MGDIITIFRIGDYIKKSRTFDFEIYESYDRKFISWDVSHRLLPKEFDAGEFYETLKKEIGDISQGYASCLFIELEEVGEDELYGETLKIVDITVRSV